VDEREKESERDGGRGRLVPGVDDASASAASDRMASRRRPNKYLHRPRVSAGDRVEVTKRTARSPVGERVRIDGAHRSRRTKTASWSCLVCSVSNIGTQEYTAIDGRRWEDTTYSCLCRCLP